VRKIYGWSRSASGLPAGLRRQAGFTIIETVIAVVLFLIFAGIATFSLTQGLRTKNSQQTYVELQQNLRTAIQQVTQDIRASTKIGPWNDPASGCDDVQDACSQSDRLSLLTTTGRYTAISEDAGTTYSGAIETHVCDARGFHRGDTVLIGNGNKYQVVKLTGVRRRRNYSQPCDLSNRDILRHRNDPISGTWTNNDYAYQAELVLYELIPDPLDSSRTVLYRRVGSDIAPAAGSGIVAFDVDDFKLSYGVPLNPAAASTSVQQMRFYDSLTQAAAALGGSYTDDPTASGIYVGTVVRAIRITLSGTTSELLRTGGSRGQYQVTETVDLR